MTASVSPYDHEALWLKAKLFLNRAMDTEGFRSFDERALWASLALELLGKSALSKVSPLLIAEPSEDGRNLLVASGLLSGDAQLVTVRAKTIFSRCQRAFTPFDAKTVEKIVRGRNEYLHDAGVGFLSIPESAWWPQYWSQAAILVSALDLDIEDLVGHDRKPVVEAHLAQNKRNLAERAETLVERAKQRMQLKRSGLLPSRVAEVWAREGDLSAGLGHSTDESCPVCGESGRLEGEEEVDRSRHIEQIDEDEYEVLVEVSVGVDYFSCENCRLVIDGHDLIEQVGIPTSFTTFETSDFDVEPDYGND